MRNEQSFGHEENDKKISGVKISVLRAADDWVVAVGSVTYDAVNVVFNYFGEKCHFDFH